MTVALVKTDINLQKIASKNKKPLLRIIQREEISSINSVNVGNAVHNLGIVKDFRSIPEINAFIPQNARLSVSWVRLKKNEVLDIHTHPIASLYIITEGFVSINGDITDGTIAKAGDIILIPKHAQHGFVGAGINGYWGLSIQFEDHGLYENIDEPLVQFSQEEEGNESFKELMARNEQYLSRFRKNKIFSALKSLKSNPSKKACFLNYLQILSDTFQRMVLLRSALCEDQEFRPLFWTHLVEEFGHNESLKQSRPDFNEVKDPIFESLCLWFTHNVQVRDKLEQLFLIHCIIESSADEFYTRLYPIFSEVEHFNVHVEHDKSHSTVGRELLYNISAKEYENLSSLQEEAWNVIEAQYERLADLSVGNK
jgi:hypothetical protein